MPDPYPLIVPPGLVKSASSSTLQGRYVNAQWIRFRRKFAERMGSYKQRVLTATPPTAPFDITRSLFTWSTKSGDDSLTIGTRSKLYNIIGSIVQDITPMRLEGTLTNAFFTTAGQVSVFVQHSAHGLENGAIVHFFGASPVGGITINGEYTAFVIDLNTYQINHSVPATSTATGGGTINYGYEINPGLSDTVAGRGWGSALWNRGLWNRPRTGTATIPIPARLWCMDKYGTHLLVQVSGGNLYEWDEAASAPRPVLVANAPIGNYMFVTEERYPIILGADDEPMKIRWPDQNDITNWTPGELNTANSRNLQHGNKLIAGAHVGNAVNLIWSDTHAFLFQYTGSDFIYASPAIGEGAGIVGPFAHAVCDKGAFWCSSDRFCMYSGSVQTIPGSEDIDDYVFKRLDPSRAHKTFAFYVPTFNEIWWMMTFTGSAEPNNYVVVCLDDWSWTTGTLTRTAGGSYRRPGGKPVMMGIDGFVYDHEFPATLNTGPGIGPDSYFLQTGNLSLGNGTNDMDIEHFIPDFERQKGTVTVKLAARNQPDDASAMEFGQADIVERQPIADFRMGGRHVNYLIQGTGLGTDLRLGICKLVMKPGGMKL